LESLDPVLHFISTIPVNVCLGKCGSITEFTLKAGSSSSCSFEISPTRLTDTFVSGRIKVRVDIFAAGGGFKEEMRWPARR
jgi:hypothetical protein